MRSHRIGLWKRKFAVVSLCAILVAILWSCTWLSPVYPILGVEITSSPRGGAYIETLACTFRVWERAFPASQVTHFGNVTAEWMANGNVHKTQHFEYDVKYGGTQSYSTTFSAPAGKYLDKTFYVVITVSGGSTATSSQASCWVP